MGLEMKVKRAVLKEIACKYQRSSKKGKGQVLEEFLGLTGYNRCYGSWLLRNCGRKVVMRGLNGEEVIIIGEIRKI
ncbi:MAG TPA: transposase, partial [Acidobacteria bacterium]|nr:transposase [Acidobacteriota bacterium]